jgi:hypothetical protein
LSPVLVCQIARELFVQLPIACLVDCDVFQCRRRPRQRFASLCRLEEEVGNVGNVLVEGLPCIRLAPVMPVVTLEPVLMPLECPAVDVASLLHHESLSAW